MKLTIASCLKNIQDTVDDQRKVQASKGLRTVDLDDDDVWNDRDEPPPYSETTVRHEEPDDNSIGFRREYLFSVEGALRLFEIVVSLIGFVAVAAGDGYIAGFVFWTTISAFISTTILFCLMAFNINSRVPGEWLVYVLVFDALYLLEYFISVILAGIAASRSSSNVAACAICLMAFLLFLLDLVLVYRKLKVVRADKNRRRMAGEGGASNRNNTFCIIF